MTLTREEEERYACDVVFAGDWEEVREQALLRLVGRCRLHIRGPWKRKLAPSSPLRACVVADWFAPDEMAAISAGAKIVLNLHSWFGKDARGTNPRVFEAAGCGAFQLCDWKEEIPAAFADGKEIILYRSLDEMDKLVMEWLPRAAERKSVAAAAAARAARDHTYHARMTELLRLMLP